MKLHCKNSLIAGIICTILLAGCMFGLYNIVQLQDPVEEYGQYVYAEKDGYEKIEFMFSLVVTGEEDMIVIYQDDTEQYLDMDFFRAPVNGFYCRYFVVYANGSVVPTEQIFIPYAENRTLMDFPEIYLSINQNISRMVESNEQAKKEAGIGIFLSFGILVLMVITSICFVEAFTKPRRRRF